VIFFNLSAFYFFYFAGVGIYVIFLPKVIFDLGFTTTQIGIIFAVAPLMRFITPFFFLKHIQLNEKVFNLSIIISISAVLCFYLSIYNFYAFLINNIVLGISLSLLLPYIEPIALKNLDKKYGKSRLYGSIGFMLISLVLAKYLTHEFVAVHYYLFVTIFTGIFAYILGKNERTLPKEEQSGKNFSIFSNIYFWIGLFLMQVSFGGFYNFFTIYETSHGVSLEMTSYMWAFGVLCEIVMLYFQAPLLKMNLLKLIEFSILITAFRWLMLYLFPDSIEVAFISQSIHAFSFALYHTAVIMYLYEVYSNKKLAQQFMLGIAYGLGGSLGAVISGWFYGEYLFLFSSIVAFTAFWFTRTNPSRLQVNNN
jgi:PPP family 3-phenylpropionic acid transporter